MKNRSLFLALLFALTLTACGTSSGSGNPDAGGTPTEKDPDYVSITATDAPAPLTGEPEDHIHALSEGDNIVEHDQMLYCGNTVTTVSRETESEDEPWETSFWGSDSVELTDLLLYLDYSGPVCKCLPEYNIDTEFGTGYGVNLTEGYVRHDGGQVKIQTILDRQGAN